MRLRPAAAGSGIVFLRTDIGGKAARIPARWRNVSDTRMCTTLANAEGNRVATVEHLMAALAGCEIDNAIVEIEGPEVPIMDGSAAPFVFLIECAGVVAQEAPRRAIRVLKPVEVKRNGATATLRPADVFTLTFEIEFDNPMVAQQQYSTRLVNGTFKSDLCRARTFGFAEEVHALRATGLALGGSLDNAVVVSGDKILNEGGLRYANEFVRHKILDSIGDLYLAGRPIIGHFHGIRSGHGLNNALLASLIADETAWCETDYIDPLAAQPEPESEPVQLAASA